MYKTLVLFSNTGDIRTREGCNGAGYEWSKCWFANIKDDNEYEVENRELMYAAFDKHGNNDGYGDKDIVIDGWEGGEITEPHPVDDNGRVFRVFDKIDDFLSAEGMSIEEKVRSMNLIVLNSHEIWQDGLGHKRLGEMIHELHGYSELCFLMHRPVEKSFRYGTHKEELWLELMNLRYGKLERKKGTDRVSSFNDVWNALECPNCKEAKNVRRNPESQESGQVSSVKQKLGALRHDLSGLMAPIKNDIEVWADSGFNEEYAKELSEDYSWTDIDKYEDTLNEIRDQIEDIIICNEKISDNNKEEINDLFSNLEDAIVFLQLILDSDYDDAASLVRKKDVDKKIRHIGSYFEEIKIN